MSFKNWPQLVERYSKLGVNCISGEARILSPWEVEVNGERITTRNIVIATGARPLVPNMGLNEVSYLTSDSIWQLEEQPKKLLVLGGGPIGCELAQSFQRLGTQVSLVEMAEQLLIREDKKPLHLSINTSVMMALILGQPPFVLRRPKMVLASKLPCWSIMARQ